MLRGPFSGRTTVTVDDGAGKKIEVAVTVPPDGEAWIDIGLRDGKTAVTNARE